MSTSNVHRLARIIGRTLYLRSQIEERGWHPDRAGEFEAIEWALARLAEYDEDMATDIERARPIAEQRIRSKQERHAAKREVPRDGVTLA